MIDYKECLKRLMIGAEFQNVEEFLETATPDLCDVLGTRMAKTGKEQVEAIEKAQKIIHIQSEFIKQQIDPNHIDPLHFEHPSSKGAREVVDNVQAVLDGREPC